jgi:plasmid stabilization system protein ParE
MTELRILAAAEAEYLSAAQWYAERSASAADGFTTAVAAAFRRILEQPEWGAACDAVHRQVIVRGYPFVIVYRAEDTPVPAARPAGGRLRPLERACRGTPRGRLVVASAVTAAS